MFPSNRRPILAPPQIKKYYRVAVDSEQCDGCSLCTAFCPLDVLDIHPVDLPFSCCPDPNGVHSYSSELWYTLAARNLALTDEQALDIVTLCNGCYATL